MELKDKIAIVIGAGQNDGVGTGNGRATVLRFCEEGANVLAVDNVLERAQATASLAHSHLGDCVACQADVTRENDIQNVVATAMHRWNRIDILHYNVGISVSGGDASVEEITESSFDLINAVNLRGAVFAVKHVLPIMTKQKNGVILTISTISARQRYPWVAYKTSKAGLIAFTQQIAIENAANGIRANTILPGLMDTPMAVDTRARTFNRSREDVADERNKRVPLRGRMGSAWDVANAAVFLASDKAEFITGVELPVDGGSLINIVR